MTSQPFKPHLPKVDLHVHLEGTLTPQMVRQLSEKNGIAIKDGLITPDHLRCQRAFKMHVQVHLGQVGLEGL